MFISPKYTWSDRLQAGVKLWFFVAYTGVSVGAIFMSVNIATRPTFGKELFTLINICSLYNLTICNFSYLSDLIYIHFEGII